MYFKPNMILKIGPLHKQNEYSTFPLNVYSNKAALLINAALTCKKNKCAISVRTMWRTNPDVKGGGLFIQGKAQVMVNELNEIMMYFNNTHGMGNCCRIATDNGDYTNKNIELVKTIKDKLANLIKECWNEIKSTDETAILYTKIYGQTNEGSYLDVLKYENNDGVTFSKNDYRCLYEYLKGRDIEKIKFKYSEKTFDDMIGHKIEDQFVITAVDLLKQQITTLNTEMRTKKQLIQDKLNADIKSLQLMAQEETSNITKTYTMQIEDINKQIIDLIKSNAGISI